MYTTGQRHYIYTQEKQAKFFLLNSVPNENLFLLLSGATIYMIKAEQNLHIFYPILEHKTCLAHELQGKLENFSFINELISNMENPFLKLL